MTILRSAPARTTAQPAAIGSRSVLPSVPHLETCLLLLLAERPGGHGYELKAEVIRVGGKAADLPGIYRALHRMESRGWVRSHWDKAVRGPAKRTYEITDRGEEQLQLFILLLRDTAWRLGVLTDRYDRRVGQSKPAVA